MNDKVERRLLPLDGFELRTQDGSPPELVGYASVFNQEAVISDWFSEWREEVAPGAFKKTLREGDIRALFNHDPNIVLGRNKAGTLELREDDHGLYTIIRPPDNEWGRPVLDAVRRKDVTGMSITFSVIKEQVQWPEKGSQELPKRTLKEVRLFDVSPVTFPAFEQTEIAARAALTAAMGEDVLLRAAALARRAQMGMALSAEDRAFLAEAIAILQSVTGEPRGAEGAEHSPVAADGEPPDSRHSADARARRLKMIRMSMIAQERER